MNVASKTFVAALVAATAVGGGGYSPAASAQGSQAMDIEEIVTIGTRRQEGRSAVDSLVPVDVLSADDLRSQGATDMDTLIANLIPSYNVNQQPINDATTLVRPAQLRGLPPDSTLVLVNGKRRHRAAVITFLGNGVTDGSQGPDISTIPSIALQRVEVLRDGAAAQYGSDAIAGVINFQLKDAAEGGALEARWGQYQEGDGDEFNFTGNIGLPLGGAGFANLSFEYKEANPTARSQQRDDAQALVDASARWRADNPNAVHDYLPGDAITDESNPHLFHPGVQVWGAPEFEYDYKFFGNFGYEVADAVEVYGHANYARRRVEGGFYYRNPHTRGGVYDGPRITHTDGMEYETILVADLTPGPAPSVDNPNSVGDGVDCPTIKILPTDRSGDDPNLAVGVVDPADVALVEADPNCESFATRFPGGFTPRFGGVMEDYSFAVGARGEIAEWFVDVSGVFGRHEADFFMRHTINPQLLSQEGITAANIPTDYNPGAYAETDYTINLDIARSLDVEGFSSPVNIAFGAEYRQEKFKATQGGQNSWYLDSSDNGLASQGFGVGSNGFVGFTPQVAGSWSRDSFAGYFDVEADVIDDLTIGAAVRYEDHENVGDTLDFKLSARRQLSDAFAVRGSYSTGFRAPTVGQANVLNITTAFTAGVLADEATLPPTHPASALLGGQPLTPEESVNYTFGMVFSSEGIDATVDFYRIEIEDRIARSSNKRLCPQAGDAPTMEEREFCDARRNTLAAQGVANASSISQVRFFTNEFDTATQGIDVVVTWPEEMFGGLSVFSLVGALFETEVTRRNPEIIDDKRVIQLEQNLPNFRFTGTAQHSNGPWNFLARARFYDGFTEFPTDSTPDLRLDAGSRTLLDLEGSYTWNDSVSVIVGAENVFDTKPSKQTQANGIVGLVFAETSPYGFNGGFYYVRTVWNF